jgi:hypothetical protein
VKQNVPFAIGGEGEINDAGPREALGGGRGGDTEI